jgi:hypothetical protein
MHLGPGAWGKYGDTARAEQAPHMRALLGAQSYVYKFSSLRAGVQVSSVTLRVKSRGRWAVA